MAMLMLWMKNEPALVAIIKYLIVLLTGGVSTMDRCSNGHDLSNTWLLLVLLPEEKHVPSRGTQWPDVWSSCRCIAVTGIWNDCHIHSGWNQGKRLWQYSLLFCNVLGSLLWYFFYVIIMFFYKICYSSNWNVHLCPVSWLRQEIWH